MAKKVECLMCVNSSAFALPKKVTKDNIEYAKRCLNIARKNIVCTWTMKTKSRYHEQYCKHYKERWYDDGKEEMKELERLERQIQEYESRTKE